MTKKKKNNNSNKYNKRVYYVEGMHCASCESLIEGEISELNVNYNVNASLKDAKVTITTGEKGIPTLEVLNQKFKDLGYKFYAEKPKAKPLSQNEILLVLTVLALVILFFKYTESTGLFINYSLGESSSLATYFIFGIIAGLSSCAALVGGLLLSLSKNWNNLEVGTTRKRMKPFVMFNFGRLLSFALLGGLLGLLGSAFKVSVELNAVLVLLVSLVMVVLGLQMLGIKWALAVPLKTPKFIASKLEEGSKLSGQYVPFFVGAVTFFIPCGFTLIAQTNALTSGDFMTSAARMTAFAVGTLPVLALLSFTSVKLYANPNFSRVFNYIVSSLVLFFAVYNINAQLNVLGYASLSSIFSTQETKALASNVWNEDGYQILSLVADGFEYSPKYSSIKANVPTKIIVNNNGVLGCATAMYARGLYESVVYLKPGENIVDIPNPQKGVYRVSCSMGMVSPIVVEVI